MGLGGSQNLLLAEPPVRSQASLPSGKRRVQEGLLAAASISQWQALPAALQPVLCPVLVRSPRSSTMNRKVSSHPKAVRNALLQTAAAYLP